MLLRSSTTALRSSTRGSSICWRLNSSSCRVSVPARWPAPWISARRPRTGSPAGMPPSSTSLYPMMTVSRLLKSWATPPASWPTASIFWACRNCSSSRRRSVTSDCTPTKCVSRPAGSFTGETDRPFQKAVPSLR